MLIKFSQLSDKLRYPKSVKGQLSTLHAEVISYVCSHFSRSYSYRKCVVNTMNSLSYYILSGDSLPPSWASNNPLEGLPLIDSDICKDVIGSLYILEKDVLWDIDPADCDVQSPLSKTPTSLINVDSKPSPSTTNFIDPTPKQDLYIQPPVTPTFRYDKPWMSYKVNGEPFVIYTSLPEIPTKQNEISVTTDVNKLTDSDLLNLYPNRFIQTRAKEMYSPHPNMLYDDCLGSILRIDGFTDDQLKDNIVRYPHIFRLYKVVNEDIVSFYNTVEIDGKLYDTKDVWADITSYPYSSDFAKEYTVRRYLLERDVAQIDHKYPIFGSLDPFLTLFTTPKDYQNLGYNDPIEMAKQCVIARVKYKQSRNPMIRKAMSCHE